jgi:TPP-dependent pyruvate/acetoin dehydrogenase alpha subunit
MIELTKECFRIRVIEEKIAEIYPTDKIQSPVHLSNGQESVSVGVCAHLKKTDLVFGTYRGHALYLAKGGSLKKMMAELYGKRTGCGKGKAGSMHLADKENGVMGCSAIVSSVIPHAVGASYAAKLRNTGQVIVCFFGDGATGEGVYHESLNFVSKHKLPVLFVCENNEWAIFTKTSDVHSFDIHSHAASYGLPVTRIKEGWDVEKIYKVTGNEIAKMRDGGCPRLVEINTFRYKQHVGASSDIGIGDRSQEALMKWKNKDPLIEPEGTALLKAAINKELAEAIEYSEISQFPTKDDLLADVY